MALRRKQDTTTGEQAKFEKVGDSISGTYLGSFDHDGDYGPTKKHLFKTARGLKVIFGQKNLTDQLAGEATGQYMVVTLSGTKKMAKGRNPMKVYTIDIDDDLAVSADSVQEEAEEALNAGETDDSLEESDEVEYADEVKTEPAKAKVNATAPSADRQKRVQDLLNKARRPAA